MSFANFRRRFRTGATKTTTDFLRDTDESPKSTGRSASEGEGKGLGWSGRGSPSPAALRAATSPRYAPLRGARCLAAARPGENATPAPRPDDRAALNLAAPSGSTASPRVDPPFALPGAAARLPECVNRHRKKVVGKGDDGLAVVQHHAGSETRACGRPGS